MAYCHEAHAWAEILSERSECFAPNGAPTHERTQRDIYGKQGWIIIKDPVIIIIKQVIITIKNLVIIISKVGLD